MTRFRDPRTVAVGTVLTLALFIPSAGPATAAAQAVETASYDTVRVNGIDLAYRDIGVGEPLVLIHGFFGTGEMWDPLLEAFPDRRLIVPDLRGHGHSTNPEEEFTHRRAARDVFALLDHLGIHTFQGIGGSTGGMTLLHMATQQPERVEAMILVAATSYFPKPAREIMRRSDPDSVRARRLEGLARQHSRGEGQARALMRNFHDFRDSYDDMNFTPPLLATITARTLIVHGDRDEFFPVEIPVEQYRSIPDSYLWILPNSGHGPLLWSESGRRRFVEVGREFLGGEWR